MSERPDVERQGALKDDLRASAHGLERRLGMSLAEFACDVVKNLPHGFPPEKLVRVQQKELDIVVAYIRELEQRPDERELRQMLQEMAHYRVGFSALTDEALIGRLVAEWRAQRGGEHRIDDAS